MAVIDGAARIISNQWVNSEYKHLVIDAGKEASDVMPGQFFNLLCPHTERDKPFFRRPMSTYFADAQSGRVEFLYKVVGAGTRGLATLEEGDMLSFLGPLGIGFTLDASWRHILVIGRGVGLATLAPLAEAAAAQNIQVTAILSARDRQRLMSQHRFADVGAQVIEVLDSDGSSDIAQVEAAIRRLHIERPIDGMFTCGSSRIADMLQKLSLELDIAGQVALEQHMACGLGMCYCCVRPMKVGEQLQSKRVCYDGPVFNIREVVL